jgi:hypothetical protein
VIKVSDEGGGIKRSNMNRIWSYLYTTADPAILDRMLGACTDTLFALDPTPSLINDLPSKSLTLHLLTSPFLFLCTGTGGNDSETLRDFDTASPLAGLGYGLPISR